MSNASFPKARSEDLVILTRPDETLVYDMIAGQAHCLNETAAFVWNQCNGEASIGEIAKLAEKRFSGLVDEEFVGFALAQLNDRKLLSSTGLSGQPRLSRRETIRRIGLASAVAVPMILSIVASANALGSLSCRGCTSPGDCFSRPGCNNTCSPLADCVPNIPLPGKDRK